MPADYQVIITSATGGRRSVPPEAVGAAQWNEEFYGGYNDFSLQLNCRTTELPAIAVTDRVEVFCSGVLEYRGYIQERGRQIGVPDSLLIKGYGLLFNLSLITCTAPIFLTSSADLVDAFDAIVTNWVRPVFSSAVLPTDTVLTGVSVRTFDATGKTVQEALNDICDLSAGTVHWGVGVDPGTGKDLLYLRLVGDRTRVISVPGAAVSASAGDTNAADVANALWLTGGTMEPQNQNLLTNADFEQVTDPGDADSFGVALGNLLTNPGFEVGGIGSGWGLTGWTQVGSGASAKHNGDSDGGADGDAGDPPAYSGDWCIELSDSTEEAQQAIGVVQAGREYGFRGYARPSDIYTATTGQVFIEWYDAGARLIRQDQILCPVTTASWQRWEGLFIAPPLATNALVRLKCFDLHTMWDAISFWDNDEPAQAGWTQHTTGVATCLMDWNDSDPPLHGVYDIEATVSGTDGTTSNEAVITPVALVPVVPGAKYVFFAWAKTTSNPHSGHLRLKFFLADGITYATDPTYSTPPPQFYSFGFTGTGIPDWTSGFVFGTAPRTAALATVEMVMWSDGIWKWDALTMMDDRGLADLMPVGSVAPGDGTAPYQPDGPLYLYFRAGDEISSMEDSEAHDSVSDFGLREGRESADSIITFANAKKFAHAYLLRRSKADVRPTVTVEGPDMDLRTGDNIRLLGPDGPALSDGKILPVARIRGTIDNGGKLSRACELGKPQPTFQGLMRAAALDEHKRVY